MGVWQLLGEGLAAALSQRCAAAATARRRRLTSTVSRSSGRRARSRTPVRWAGPRHEWGSSDGAHVGDRDQGQPAGPTGSSWARIGLSGMIENSALP
jgi:hypothetical protein